MGDYNYIGNIKVFRNTNYHILVQEIGSSRRSNNNKFFDLHDCETIIMTENSPDHHLVELNGKEKTLAFGIYNHWKRWKNEDYVKQKAKINFPTSVKPAGHKNLNSKTLNTTYTSKKNIPKQDQNNFDQYENKHPEILKSVTSRVNKPAIPTREQAIRKIVEKRKIEFLFHFTHIDNLESILKRGLLSQDEVKKLKKLEKVRINDDQRIDNHPEAICLSISFPNYKMFYTFHKGICDDWIVISLKPEILWQYECAFCHTNAASNACRHISIEDRKKVGALNRLFEDFENIKREKLAIPEHYPTDPQAEVLVFDKIPVEDFLKVYFYNWNRMNYYKETYPMFENLFEINRNYFRARQDYRHWQNNQNYKVNEPEIIEDDNDICHFPW